MYTCRMSILAVESGIALAGTALATDELTQEHTHKRFALQIEGKNRGGGGGNSTTKQTSRNPETETCKNNVTARSRTAFAHSQVVNA